MSYLDTKRLDKMPAKFDKRTYDNGQYKFQKDEMYCEPCDVWVRSRDQMQAHKEGANHKKKSAKVQRFECKLCLIEVPCQVIYFKLIKLELRTRLFGCKPPLILNFYFILLFQLISNILDVHF